MNIDKMQQALNEIYDAIYEARVQVDNIFTRIENKVKRFVRLSNKHPAEKED